jgi:hypothetical protein
MLRSPSKNNMSNIRDLFTSKDKVPPDLRHALSLLKLHGFEDLEERFLSTDAFLKPWSVFRDSILLLAPQSMPCATLIKGAGSGISRLDLLWFYTQFDEGNLRYDPRTDRYSASYTPDASVYGVIDKGNWRVEEYEKHLYAWLLQDFKVGKAYSPWRFECFELKNICTVWEDVLVPIVNAVRASYDRRGRRHYGRLALFVEERCPSRLAFPDSNIGIPEGGILSPTPYRVVSAPRKVSTSSARLSHSRQNEVHGNGVLSKKHYDETEKELRNVYPQYGGLVERPKFKHKMDEWLAEQRARATRRKEVERRHGEVQTSRPQVVQRNGSRSPSKQLPEASHGSIRRKKDGSESPIKQFSASVKRTVSQTMSAMKFKEEPKSPLHGVTRQLQFLDDTKPSTVNDFARNSMEITPLPRPAAHHMPSQASVYTSIRNSNPFTKENQDTMKARARANSADSSLYTPKSQRMRENNSPIGPRVRAGSNDSVFSPMGQLSAIPRPLKAEAIDSRDFATTLGKPPAMHSKKSYHDVRVPSYEGTAYGGEISLTDLHNQRLQAARSPESTRSAKLATRLPAPIVPIPYSGPRVASADKDGSPSKTIAPPSKPSISPSKPLPKAIALPQKPAAAPPKYSGPSAHQSKKSEWLKTTPPKTTAWPGFDSDSDNTPPIPPKSPSRSRNPGQLRNPRSRQIMREDRHQDLSRIVSKENIRAALGRISRESSTEDLAPPKPFGEPVRSTSQKLQAYNTNMFPRKEGTPAGDWFATEKEKGRYEPGGAFEMEILGGEKKDGRDER